eukprot:scaffold210379_cov17-Tisochrysis_lutea.AAC.1
MEQVWVAGTDQVECRAAHEPVTTDRQLAAATVFGILAGSTSPPVSAIPASRFDRVPKVAASRLGIPCKGAGREHDGNRSQLLGERAKGHSSKGRKHVPTKCAFRA